MEHFIYKNNSLKNCFVFFVGSICALLFLEIFLKIYRPFETRIKGDKLILPTNKTYRIKNNKISRLDKLIIHKKNSLGFRGNEPPINFSDYLTIIAVGGSTTECFYLQEDKAWVHLLNKKLQKNINKLWINNAGLAGHSTFGHLVLLQDYVIKLKPKIVLLLIGINDVGRNIPSGYDLLNQQKIKFEMSKIFLKSIAHHSEIAAYLLNIYRSVRGIGDKEIDFRKLKNIEIPNTNQETYENEQRKYLDGFEQRLRILINTCKVNRIEPILITQPTVVGYGTDEITNVDLGKVKIENTNGELFWSNLELYNNITRKLAHNNNLYIIDLAKEMPKSTRYYYDTVHFTNEGAEKVSEIVSHHLFGFLAHNYPEFFIN